MEEQRLLVSELRRKLSDAYKEIERLKNLNSEPKPIPEPVIASQPVYQHLSNSSISRYSRHLLIPEIGVQGQLRLLNGSVLIVGAGGLGSPAGLFLAAAGVGKIGIVDYDDVELSNLQRQIIHTEARVGQAKSYSAAASMRQVNSQIICEPFNILLDRVNAKEIIQHYDVVIDATDNAVSRYILSDTCVHMGKPLISGSALRLEGQLTTYNFEEGPCYRCLFPTPPPVESVTNCSDGGVLGVVPGIIGSLQALEAIKIISGIGSSFSRKLLLFDALSASFRTIKLRGKMPHCIACGETPSIDHFFDYEKFCGSSAHDKCIALNILGPEERITCAEFQSIRESQIPHLLVDCRPSVEYAICSLPGSLSLPLRSLQKKDESYENLLNLLRDINRVFFLCRRGNDSQLAVRFLKSNLPSHLQNIVVQDLKGGLSSWAASIDPSFPMY